MPRVTAQRTAERVQHRVLPRMHGKVLTSEASRVGTPCLRSVVAEVVRQHQVRMRPREWRVPVVARPPVGLPVQQIPVEVAAAPVAIRVSPAAATGDPVS